MMESKCHLLKTVPKERSLDSSSNYCGEMSHGLSIPASCGLSQGTTLSVQLAAQLRRVQTPRVDTGGFWVMEVVSEKPKEADLGGDGQKSHCGDH